MVCSPRCLAIHCCFKIVSTNRILYPEHYHSYIESRQHNSYRCFFWFFMNTEHNRSRLYWADITNYICIWILWILKIVTSKLVRPTDDFFLEKCNMHSSRVIDISRLCHHKYVDRYHAEFTNNTEFDVYVFRDSEHHSNTTTSHQSKYVLPIIWCFFEQYRSKNFQAHFSTIFLCFMYFPKRMISSSA